MMIKATQAATDVCLFCMLERTRKLSPRDRWTLFRGSEGNPYV